MKELELIKNYPWILNIIYTIIAIVIGSIIYGIVSNFITKKIEKNEAKLFDSKKSKTYLKMIRSILKYVFLVIMVLVILRVNGVNVTSMIAGVGIISIIIGFAIQDALKDIIKGLDIISDNYYQVGDVIKYLDITGKVTAIGIKTTKVEDIYTMNKVSISNRNIEKVEVVSHMINIDIPLPYEEKVEKIEKVLEEIIVDLKQIEDVENVEYRGINDFAESSINYHIKVFANPSKKPQVRRNALTCIMKGLEKHNISVPYNQLDIHNK